MVEAWAISICSLWNPPPCHLHKAALLLLPALSRHLLLYLQGAQRGRMSSCWTSRMSRKVQLLLRPSTCPQEP